MKMNIGTNIKRLRLAKRMTQEQLASMLGVSTAAVSKWEAQNTYPDITLLFPLARLFGVSVDELMGYDEAKVQAEINAILDEYFALGREGAFVARDKLIKRARKKYPQDFRIMNTYMWHIAGGSADNDPGVLLCHKEELMQICDCILDGCTVDDLRASALNLNAKLLHAEGKTDEAVKLLETLPSLPATQFIEQLFAKETQEFRYWNERNCISLLDFAAVKFARIIRFDPNLSAEEKTAKLESAAQAFADLQTKSGLALFCIAEQSTLATAEWVLEVDDDNIDSILRIYEKRILAMQKMMHLAENDDVLNEWIKSIYKTDDLIGWMIDRMMTSQHRKFTALRERPETKKMIQKYRA